MGVVLECVEDRAFCLCERVWLGVWGFCEWVVEGGDHERVGVLVEWECVCFVRVVDDVVGCV